MGHRRGRDQPYVADQRGHSRRHEDGVQAAAYLVGPSIRPVGARRLQGERVFDGDEINQTLFGFGDEINPVPGGE